MRKPWNQLRKPWNQMRGVLAGCLDILAKFNLALWLVPPPRHSDSEEGHGRKHFKQRELKKSFSPPAPPFNSRADARADNESHRDIQQKRSRAKLDNTFGQVPQNRFRLVRLR